MQTRTGLRVGIKPQELVRNIQDSAWETQQNLGNAAQGVSATAQGAVAGIQDWWTTSDAGDKLNRFLWFPLEPPQ